MSEDPVEAEGVLRGLGLDEPTVAAALEPEIRGAATYRPSKGVLILFVSSPEVNGAEVLARPVGLLLSEDFCVTVRRGPIAFLNEVWRSCPDDFRRFAKSPGFLLYEFWDHLIGSYRVAADRLGDRVLQAQDEAFEAGDEIFGRVSGLSRDLLSVRRAMVSAREVLAELTNRRSTVVPASTMPYLQALLAALDRLVSDLAVEREILSETLNLYIGLVGHRTNQVVNRLTVVSFVFLPLTFLCGVYGMNFRYFPELEWRFAYPFFWLLTSAIVATSLTYMRRRGWW